MNSIEKDKELKRIYEIVTASFDYIIQKNLNDPFKDDELNIVEYYKKLKVDAKVIYEQGKMKKLAQWYRDLTEGSIYDPKFLSYIKEHTGYDIKSDKELEKRISVIIKRKKIITEDEYRDVMEMISYLNVKNEPKKMETLQSLIDNYSN
jgi:hypothetical protein